MKKLGRYQIEEIISENGPVSVYVARHEVLGRKTLLKVYSGGDKELTRRFEQEARIVANFKESAIVSIYDFGEWNRKFFIAMEYVDGWNLGDYLREQQLNIAEKIKLCRKISEAVHVIHRHGFVHRDLKPDNIMVNREHEIKITDFGISLQQSMARATSEGALVGTPLYMSPEQINNLELGPASDVFSLGIIFYEMITGKNPFEARQYGEIFANILTKTPDALPVTDEIPAWFSRLVSDMLIKEPETRIGSAEEILERFRAAGYTSEIQMSSAEDKKVPENVSPLKSRIRWIPAALILLAAIIMAAVYREPLAMRMGWTTIRPDTSSLTHVPPDTIPNNQSEEFQSNTVPQNNKPVTLDMPENRSEESVRPSENIEESFNENKSTTFFIETFPWSKVYLNFSYLDTAPLDSAVEINPGRYLLSLRHPDYVPTWSDSIEIKPHRRNTFAFNLDTLYYRLDLDVHPWGKVYVDDRYIGDTPLSSPLLLSRRDHKITVRNEYFESWQDTIRWTGETHVTKKIVLQKMQ